MRLLYTCHQAFIVYMSSGVYCIHVIRRLFYTTIRRLLYTCHHVFIAYMPLTIYCMHVIKRLLYACHQAFIVYMPSGVYCIQPSGVYCIQPSGVYSGAVYYTHIILYSGSSLCGLCCSSRQITCFRVLIPYRAVRNDFGIKMMFGSSLAQLVYFSGEGDSLFYICYLYIFTYTGVQHDFNII